MSGRIASSAPVRFGCAIVFVSAALLAAPGAANATFPGGDGKVVYHSNKDGNFEIYAMNPDGTGDTRLTTNAAIDQDPAWSPDGKKIAFTSNRDGNDEIYIMDADGTGQTRLTNHAMDDEEPSWSPDPAAAAQIVFASNRDGDVDLWKMNGNTGAGVTQVLNSPGFDGTPSWSPDGTKIAFVSNRDGNNEIYKVNADGTTPQRLTTNSVPDEYPDWSPDNKRIIWHNNLSGNFDVWVMNADGSNKSNITVAPSSQSNGVYAPDNSNFAYSNDTDGDLDIWSTYCCSFPKTINNALDNEANWQPLVRSHARPKSATPIRLSLVPAYQACVAPNTVHKPPVNYNSCNPANQTSPYLTVGTPTANGAAANSVGFVSMQAFCNGGAPNELPPCSTTGGDQLDGKLTVSFTDLRCSQGTSGGCGAGYLSDYSGDVLFKASVRITDENSLGLGGATVVDADLFFSVPCADNGDPNIGSACSEVTSLDALIGAGSVVEQKRAIWEFDDVRLMDGGFDGVANTEGDNSLFAQTGLFFP